MALPLRPPVLPQLAKSQKSLPEGEGWVYEPKWDGFRSIAFVDGDTGPPAVAQRQAADALLPGAGVPRGALRARRRDRALRRPRPPGLRRARPAHPPGEVAHRHAGRDDADALHRLRPARASTTRSLLELPQRERRARLEQLIEAPVDLTPASEDPADAQPWLQGAEGVIAKRQEAPYRPGERVGMVKIKRLRTIDAVVQGWRPGKEEGTRRLAQPRALRRRRPAAQRRPHLRLHGQAEARAAGLPRPLRDRRALRRRAEPLERLARARAARPAARAGRRSDLRPHQQRAHPPRREDPALARGQGPAGVHDGAARPVIS